MALTEEHNLGMIKLIILEHYGYIPENGAYHILTDMEFYGLTNLAWVQGIEIDLLKRNKKLRISIILKPCTIPQ